ncbi:MAG: nucleotidyltransferase family protein [Deltaproteobacteria bacterium]|nr:nucleotidyltransferase family protein [Deltaproteobacteria bacterium]MBI2366238.1 nucleotidyltransferase family protein [Deltaproteobacteria bacterium]
MDIAQILETKKEDILQIAAKHGARNVRVFGSVARGEARPDSDVDLLVEVGPNRTPFFPGGLVADLEELLGKKVQVVTPEGLHWYIRDRVLEEAVPL